MTKRTRNPQQTRPGPTSQRGTGPEALADRAPEPQCQRVLPGYTLSPGPAASAATSPSPAATAAP